jgi:thymidylate synthase (FAD)
VPQVWRGRSADKKQCSDGVVHDVLELEDGPYFSPEDGYSLCLEMYEMLLNKGVAPEQARMVLPQSTMTEWYWSGSLDAFANMCNLRLKPDTQFETRLVANAISIDMKKIFPVSWEALVK